MYKNENYQSKKVKKKPQKPVDSNHQSSHLGFFFLLACVSSSTVLYIIYYLTFQQFFLISRSKRDKLQELKFLALMLYSVHVYKYERLRVISLTTPLYIHQNTHQGFKLLFHYFPDNLGFISLSRGSSFHYVLQREKYTDQFQT